MPRRVKDLKQEEIVVGLKMKGLATGVIGTVVKIDYHDDNYAWVQWEGQPYPYSGFYGTDSDCEVVEESH